MVKIGLIARRRYKGKKIVVKDGIEYYISYINKNVTTGWKTKTENWFAQNDVSGYLCQKGVDIELKTYRYSGRRWFAYAVPDIIKKMIRRSESDRTRLVVYDRELSDESCEGIMKMADSARYITLVTDNCEKAAKLAERMYDELGLFVDSDITDGDISVDVDNMAVRNNNDKVYEYTIEIENRTPVPAEGAALAEILWKNGLAADKEMLKAGRVAVPAVKRS